MRIWKKNRFLFMIIFLTILWIRMNNTCYIIRIIYSYVSIR